MQAHVRCTCGNEFMTRATREELHVEVCSNCHPFYTGRQKLMDTGGRVERFQRRVAKGRLHSAQTGPPSSPMSAAAGRGGADDAGRALTPSGADAGLERRRRLPTVELSAQRDAPVGGQAVLEGVMMRGVSQLGGRRAQADAPSS